MLQQKLVFIVFVVALPIFFLPFLTFDFDLRDLSVQVEREVVANTTITTAAANYCCYFFTVK